MRTLKVNNKFRLLIYPLVLLFFIIGLYYFEQTNFFVYRFVRVVLCFTYLGIILWYYKSQTPKLVIYFILLYGLSSLFSVWYENNISAIISISLSFLSFLIIVISLLSKISLKKMRGVFLIGFVIMILVNGFLMYKFIEMISGFTLSTLHHIMVICSTICLLLASFLTFLYNDQYSTRATFLFLCFFLFLFFSEIFRAFAYYKFAFGEIDVHIARILLLLSFCLIVEYTFISKTKEEDLFLIKSNKTKKNQV